MGQYLISSNMICIRTPSGQSDYRAWGGITGPTCLEAKAFPAITPCWLQIIFSPLFDICLISRENTQLSSPAGFSDGMCHDSGGMVQRGKITKWSSKQPHLSTSSQRTPSSKAAVCRIPTTESHAMAFSPPHGDAKWLNKLTRTSHLYPLLVLWLAFLICQGNCPYYTCHRWKICIDMYNSWISCPKENCKDLWLLKHRFLQWHLRYGWRPCKRQQLEESVPFTPYPRRLAIGQGNRRFLNSPHTTPAFRQSRYTPDLSTADTRPPDKSRWGWEWAETSFTECE